MIYTLNFHLSVTLCGILLREARGSAKCICMFAPYRTCESEAASDYRFSNVSGPFRPVHSCNGIPQTVAGG